MVITQVKSETKQLQYQVTWEKLPENYLLPDDPVENTSQPLLAAALRENLELIGFLKPQNLVASNHGICATVNGRTVVKAPDWFYVPRVLLIEPPRARRSYTPSIEGEFPAIVMEFLSENDCGEYSYRPYFPYGKFWFYERILRVPLYIIFEPEQGTLEVRKLEAESYQMEQLDENQTYWVECLNLYLGVWYGTKGDRTGFWLRWWDPNGNLLLWGAESLAQERQKVEQERQRAEQEHQRAEQERQRAEQEHQRAEQEHQRAEQLAAYLRSQGINPEEIS